MTEKEDLIIDQLYFVTPFSKVAAEINLDQEILAFELWQLIEKGWVKCFNNPEDEIQISRTDFDKNYMNYHYLASKKGLLAHNSR